MKVRHLFVLFVHRFSPVQAYWFADGAAKEQVVSRQIPWAMEMELE